jgi:hypothetical protein
LAAASLWIGRPQASAITNGELDGQRHPNVGAMVVYIPEADDFFEFCSGTLIDDQVFLTAGHCVAAIEYYIGQGLFTADDVYVSFHSTDLKQGLISVAGWIAHPDYPGKDNVHTAVDVGVLILSAAPGLTPATLAPANYLGELKKSRALSPRGQKFVAVGYGTQLSFPPPIILDPDGARWLSTSSYRSLSGNFLYLSQNIPAGNGGTGYGDSGGPRFWTNANNQEVLVAITSRGDPNLVTHDVAQRVDIPVVLNWLDFIRATY